MNSPVAAITRKVVAARFGDDVAKAESGINFHGHLPSMVSL